MAGILDCVQILCHHFQIFNKNCRKEKYLKMHIRVWENTHGADAGLANVMGSLCLKESYLCFRMCRVQIFCTLRRVGNCYPDLLWNHGGSCSTGKYLSVQGCIFQEDKKGNRQELSQMQMTHLRWLILVFVEKRWIRLYIYTACMYKGYYGKNRACQIP